MGTHLQNPLKEARKRGHYKWILFLAGSQKKLGTMQQDYFPLLYNES